MAWTSRPPPQVPALSSAPENRTGLRVRVQGKQQQPLVSTDSISYKVAQTLGAGREGYNNMTVALVVLAVLAFIFTIAVFFDDPQDTIQRRLRLVTFRCSLAVTVMLVFAAIWSASRPVPDYPPDEVVVRFCESAWKAPSFLHPRIQADPDLSARILEWKEPLKKTLAGTYVPTNLQWDPRRKVPTYEVSTSDLRLEDINVTTRGIEFLGRDQVLIRFAGTFEAIANEAEEDEVDFPERNFSGEATLGRVKDRWWIEDVKLNTNSEGDLLW